MDKTNIVKGFLHPFSQLFTRLKWRAVQAEFMTVNRE
jgi:hypothetical protein